MPPVPGASASFLANLQAVVPGIFEQGAELTPMEAEEANLGRGEDHAARERAGAGLGRIDLGCGRPAENSRRGEAGCLRGLGWQWRENAVWEA